MSARNCRYPGHLVLANLFLALVFLNPAAAQHGVAHYQKLSALEGDFDGDLDSGDDDGASHTGAVWILFLDLLTGVDDPDQPIVTTPAARARLLAAVPNSVNPRTTIRYELASRSNASIHIHDIAGRLVRSFELGVQPPGAHSVQWDGRGGRGRMAPGGTYLVRLETPGAQDAIRVSLVK